MTRILTITAATFAPAPALAHTDGSAHAEMAVASELVHMLNDPLHLGLLAAAVVAGALAWKVMHKKDAEASAQAD